MIWRYRINLRSRARVLTSLFVLLASLAVVCGVSARPAAAADNGRWSVFPTTAKGQSLARPYFQPLLTPGVPVRDSLTITNETKTRLKFHIYGSDAYNSPSGQFLLKLSYQPMHDIGTWIHLPVSTLTLRAKRAVKVPFTITPPANATPGDHAGGIIVEGQPSAAHKSGALQIHQIDAVAVRMYARVRGPLSPSLSVTSVHLDPSRGGAALFGAGSNVNVSYTVTNTGNVNLTPTADLSVSAVLGSTHHRTSVIPQLLPGGSATIHQEISGVKPSVILHSKVVVTAKHTAGEASASVWNIPWLLLAIIVAIIAAIVWYRRRRRGTAPPEDATGRHREPTNA
ncbi:MAG TPA: DUF916 domain-containing protein [Mycobacteriales bacterium]|nr:DUF916 domain-containing protein [Mycobacteriales bacterium]